MKTMFAVAAALSLLAGSAVAATPGLTCPSGPSEPATQGTGPGPGAGFAVTGESPSGNTCEMVMHRDGTMSLNDGPNADNRGLSSAPHEGAGGTAGATSH